MGALHIVPSPPIRAESADFVAWQAADVAAHGALLDGLGRPARASRLLTAALSFHPRIQLAAARFPDLDHDVFALYDRDEAGRARVLNGGNAAWYALGEDGLALDPRSVVDYVRCFLHFVWPEQGRFRVAAKATDLRWRAEADPATRRRAEDLLLPPVWLGHDRQARLRLALTVLFGAALFRVGVAVVPTRAPGMRRCEGLPGTVELLDEVLLLDRLPMTED